MSIGGCPTRVCPEETGYNIRFVFKNADSIGITLDSIPYSNISHIERNLVFNDTVFNDYYYDGSIMAHVPLDVESTFYLYFYRHV